MSTGFGGGFMPVGPDGPGSPAVPDVGGDAPEFTTHVDGQPGGDPEALSKEREEYPDPEEYPLADPADTTDGETPDADLQVGGHD
jgi:hypothetical protein